MRGRRAIATPVTRARTPTIWRGRARRSRCRRCSIRGRCSNACSATAWRLTPEARARENLYRRSILDFVSDDTRKLETDLGPTDRRKLDEYLSSIREIERQIEKAEKDNAQIDPHMEKPYGVPADFAEHFKLMTDMMTVAFQSDLTRVITFLVTHEGTSRPYREIDIPDGHHPLTHHRNQPDLIEKVTQINCYHVRQFAAWIAKMQVDPGRRRLAARQLHDRLRRGALRRQPPSARRPADPDRRARRQPFQVRTADRVPERDADVQSLPGDDGSHGRARGAFRRFDRTPGRIGSHLNMQFPGTAKPPVGIVFDSAMSRIDDVLALAMLHGFDGKERSAHRGDRDQQPDLPAAQFCDAMRPFYASATTGTGGYVHALRASGAGGREARRRSSAMFSKRHGDTGRRSRASTIRPIWPRCSAMR